MKNDPATERQIEYIQNLGGNPQLGMSKEEASEMIKELLGEKDNKPTKRQMMVLRFWGKFELYNSTKSKVSEWIDIWYDDDPRRREAWDLWKQDFGDNGDDNFPPEIVEEGVGHDYFVRVSENQSSLYTIIPEENIPLTTPPPLPEIDTQTSTLDESMIHEFQRTCKSCGKIWHSLASRERDILSDNALNACEGITCCSTSKTMQARRNLEAGKTEIARLRSCPSCGSSLYNEELISHNRQT